jgi:hypothetical protein
MMNCSEEGCYLEIGEKNFCLKFVNPPFLLYVHDGGRYFTYSISKPCTSKHIQYYTVYIWSQDEDE